MNTLYVLPPSHYCERARWALEAAGLPFQEVGWAVGFHIRRARRLAPASSAPILRLADGRVIQGSGAICDHAGLAGGDPALEARLAETTAPLIRQWVYAATLATPGSGVREALLDGATVPEAPLARLAWPLIRRAMMRGMDATPDRVPALGEALEAELAALDAAVPALPMTADGRPARAALTLAALLSPLLLPILPRYDRIVLPDAIRARLAAWNARPALAFARAMYAGHRG